MLKMRSEGTIKELPEDILLPPISHVEQEDLTFLDLLLIITQRKRLIGIVTAVCTGIALILAFTIPQLGRAELVITECLIEPPANSGEGPDNGTVADAQ